MPSTRRRVPEGGFAPSNTPFARLDIGIGYRIPMGEVVVPRPWDHPQVPRVPRVRGFGFGFGNPIYRQGVYLRLS